MVKLIVKGVSGKKFQLVNAETKEEYEVEFTFYGFEQEKAVTGSLIMMHKELLDPDYVEYATEYIFGPLDEPYGRRIDSVEHKDYLAIKLPSGEVYKLKRFFG